MRRLPAAAIPKGATVQMEDGPEVTISKVRSSDPIAGRITWEDGTREYEIGAAVRVQVVSLP